MTSAAIPPAIANDQPLHLYSARLCPYAMRVRHALAEKGLAARLTEIDLRNKPPGFSEISPNGKVPLLLHGAARIWEAAAICEYLEDIFPENPLFPVDAAARAHARIWTMFADTRLYDATNTMFHSSDRDVWARTVMQLATDIGVIEDQAFANADGPFILGAQMSLADIALYPWFDQVCVLEAFCGLKTPSNRPRIERWRSAMRERPAMEGIVKTPQAWLEAYGRLLKAA